MIFCKELDKEFSDKEAMFAELVETKKISIDRRKSEIKTKRCSLSLSPSGESSKSVASGGVEYGQTIFPVINSTNFLDSHGDVHGKNIWNKSAKEQNGKVYFVVDHDLKFGSVISYPKDVNILVKELPWSALGRDYKGTTNALIFETKINEYANKAYVEGLKNGMPIEHSIRMRYIDVELAVNSDKYEDEYKVWKDNINSVANRDDAEDVGYFYFVKEAAICMEGSAVLFGSNDATPRLDSVKDIEPSGDTHDKQEGVKNAPVWLNLM